MADLSKVAEAYAPSNVRKYLGTVVTQGGVRKVLIGDKILFASWADPIVVDDGDTVEVEVVGSEAGQSKVRVTARSTTQPRSRTGTVTAVPASSATIIVTALGISHDAEFVGTYVVNDVVHLDWGAGRPRVIGKVTQTAAPAPLPLPTAPAPAGGQSDGAAIRSGTFWAAGGWNSWAGGRENVYQGDYGSGPLTGAWFYGGRFNGLAGKTITRVRFRTGTRRPIGNNNATLAANFYTHTSSDQPGGNVAITGSVFSRNLAPGNAAEWIELPAAFGAAIVAGGGIAISGGSYLGMDGRAQQADSGALILDWI